MGFNSGFKGLKTTKLPLHSMDCSITQEIEIQRPLFQDIRLLLTTIRSSSSHYLRLSSGSRGHTDGQIDRQMGITKVIGVLGFVNAPTSHQNNSINFTDRSQNSWTFCISPIDTIPPSPLSLSLAFISSLFIAYWFIMNGKSFRQVWFTVDFKPRNEDNQHSACPPPLLHKRWRRNSLPSTFHTCFCDDVGRDQGTEKQLKYSELEALCTKL